MHHGTVILKKDIIIDETVRRKKGEKGLITEYLPDQDRISIMFDNKVEANSYFTLTKDGFNDYCDSKLL